MIVFDSKIFFRAKKNKKNSIKFENLRNLIQEFIKIDKNMITIINEQEYDTF